MESRQAERDGPRARESADARGREDAARSGDANPTGARADGAPADASAAAGAAGAESTGEPAQPPPSKYPPDTGTGTDPQETLRAFARPRLAGSPGVREVRAGVRRRLEKLGYETRELPFDFSAFPGRFALPVAAGTLAVASVFGAIVLGVGFPVVALILLVVGAVLAGAVAALAIPMIDRLPWGRVEGRNVLAQMPGSRPRYIVMAHMDSKAQLVPLSLRAPAIGLLVIGWAVLLVLSILALAEPFATPLVVVAAIVALACGILLALSLADDRSPGALDNASGLAALVAIAAREREHGDIGFLATDAEELGLAGARAVARTLPPVFGVLNLDGIDDDGLFYVMERFGFRRRGLAPNLAAALLGAGVDQNVPIERRDLPYGLMVDHIPIVEAGQPAVTVMRGTLKSLHRVHRPGDTLEHLRGTGVAQAVDLVCGALARLREQAPARSPTGSRVEGGDRPI
jgi:hypothetical protein